MLRSRISKGISLLFFAFLASLWLPAGCTSLCTKHLYLYRDTEKRTLPTSNLALLITDPELANGVMPAAKGYLEAGCPWAQEQRPAYETEVYLLSIDNLDGRPVYQGLCMDTTPTYSIEVQPGTRQVRIRLDILGPEGQEKIKEVTRLTLEPGRGYFLRPDCEALKSKRFLLKVEPLPEPYTAELRARLINWKRQHVKGKFMED